MIRLIRTIIAARSGGDTQQSVNNKGLHHYATSHMANCTKNNYTTTQHPHSLVAPLLNHFEPAVGIRTRRSSTSHFLTLRPLSPPRFVNTDPTTPSTTVPQSKQNALPRN